MGFTLSILNRSRAFSSKWLAFVQEKPVKIDSMNHSHSDQSLWFGKAVPPLLLEPCLSAITYSEAFTEPYLRNLQFVFAQPR